MGPELYFPVADQAAACVSGEEGAGIEKHEISAAAFSGNLFYDIFLQGEVGNMTLSPPPDPLLFSPVLFLLLNTNKS